MSSNASTAPATAPKFRVVIVNFAWTETSAAALKKQAEGMFAGASVVIEPNEPAPRVVAADEHEKAQVTIQQLSDASYAKEETITQLQKENARLTTKADTLTGAILAAQTVSSEKAAQLAAAPVKFGDILKDNHTGKFVLVTNVGEGDFEISDMSTREVLWRVKFESAGEFTVTTAKDFATAHEKFSESQQVDAGSTVDAGEPAKPATESAPAASPSPENPAAVKRTREKTAAVKAPAASAKTGAPRATAAKRVRVSHAKKPAPKKSRAKKPAAK